MNKTYIKTKWVDGKTPVNAQNLGKIEQAIYDLYLKTIDKGSIVGKGNIVTETDENGNLVITQKELIQSKSLVAIEYSNVEPETKLDGYLYVIVREDGQVKKIYHGKTLIMERLVNLDKDGVSENTEIIPEGCIWLVGGTHILVGDGKTEVKNLKLIPLNVQGGSVFLGEAKPNETLDKGGMYLAKTPGNFEGINIEQDETAILYFDQESDWTKISLGKISKEGHTHIVSDITDFPESMPASDVHEWAKAETKPTYQKSEIIGLQEALNGKADLSSGKVPDNQLPDKVFKNLHYAGVWAADTNTPTLENNKLENEGKYYIVKTAGYKFNANFLPNDIVYNAGGNWFKLCGSELRGANSFKVKSFTTDAYKYEIGSTVDVVLNWEYEGIVDNTQVSSQDINGETVSPELRTVTFKGVKNSTTYKLTSTYTGSDQVAELKVDFLPKVLFGKLNKTTATDEELLAFDSVWSDESLVSLVDFSGGNYLFVAIPTSVRAKYSIKLNELIANNFTEETKNLTNKSGSSVPYTIVKFPNKYNGELKVELIYNK